LKVGKIAFGGLKVKKTTFGRFQVQGEVRRLVPAKLINEDGSHQSSPCRGYDRQALGVGGLKVASLVGTTIGRFNVKG